MGSSAYTAALQRSNRCAPPPASRFFAAIPEMRCRTQLFEQLHSIAHAARGCSICSTRSSLCKWPHRWKAVALCCRRSLGSELELCYAQNGLQVLASSRLAFGWTGSANRAREAARIEAPYARGRQKYREDSCERTTASSALTRSTQLKEQLQQQSSQPLKAPSTRAHK